ncbi:MAG: hypothetical protein WEF50_22090 [Myxococcota bacterium]
MNKPVRNVLLAAGLFLLGAVAFKLLDPSLEGTLDTWTLVRILALLFLANGLYGLGSGRVYGRSWEKYWGGWCYRTEEPFYYWSYTLGHLLIGTFLLWVRR